MSILPTNNRVRRSLNAPVWQSESWFWVVPLHLHTHTIHIISTPSNPGQVVLSPSLYVLRSENPGEWRWKKGRGDGGQTCCSRFGNRGYRCLCRLCRATKRGGLSDRGRRRERAREGASAGTNDGGWSASGCAGQRCVEIECKRVLGSRGRTRLSHWKRLAARGVDWASAPAAREEATTMDASMVCSQS